jgi:hypothetical protein
MKRYDRAFELASDVINENFTARTIFRVGDRFLIFEHCPQENSVFFRQPNLRIGDRTVFKFLMICYDFLTILLSIA